MKVSQSLSWFFFLAVFGCIEEYPPPVSSEEIDFLVVDGFIDGTEGTVGVKLTRAIPLDSGDLFPEELDALVHIENTDGVVYPLNDVGNGNYENNAFIVEDGQEYRLSISRADGREYFSEYVSVKSTPPIDSVVWRINQLRDGFEILVNTHDEANSTRYYQWAFEETYEYTSPFLKLYKYENDTIVDIPPSEYPYRCWRTLRSQKILVASSEQLDNDIISNFVVNEVPVGSQKFTYGYSILVKQRALTAEAYMYWLNLQKTTEQLGGFFDPQPGKVSGNIFCNDNPGEPVIGFFDASTIQVKRLFIRNSDLPVGFRSIKDLMGCRMDTVSVSDAEYVAQTPGFSLVSPIVSGISIVGFLYSRDYCADCRVQGGTLTKPAYWE